MEGRELLDTIPQVCFGDDGIAPTDGKAYCWGDNISGQLGNGDPSNFPARSHVPVLVVGQAP